MGYGARVGKAASVHDRLFARALCLAPERPENTGIALVSADLCLLDPRQAQSVRERISSGSGLPPERILVQCTHTHSGPDTGFEALNTGRALPTHVDAILDGLTDAGLRAAGARAPASLRWCSSEVRIGRNRSLEDGALDPTLHVLDVRTAAGDALATLYHYACHPTVLGHDNLEISADWPGVTSARLERETGAVALFMLGAHADIDPRTRGLMDLCIPGQSVGLGFDAVRVLGEEVADAALEALEQDGAAARETSVGAASCRVSLPLHLGDRSADATRLELERRKRELAGLLGVTAQELPRLSQLDRHVSERVRDMPVAEAREQLARARLYVRDKTAPFFVSGQREIDVEIQVLRVGDAAILALPLEPTTEVGLDWRRRTAGKAIGKVAGIANGWLRYLPRARDLAHPQAHHRYEVLSSILAPGACEARLTAGEQLLTRIDDAPEP